MLHKYGPSAAHRMHQLNYFLLTDHAERMKRETIDQQYGAGILSGVFVGSLGPHGI